MGYLVRWVGIAGLLLMAILLGAASCDEGKDSGSVPSQSPLAQQQQVTPEQAQSAALATVPGATVAAERLAKAGKTVVYDVTLQPTNGDSAEEIQINANTGKVLKMEPARGSQDDDGDGGD